MGAFKPEFALNFARAVFCWHKTWFPNIENIPFHHLMENSVWYFVIDR